MKKVKYKIVERRVDIVTDSGKNISGKMNIHIHGIENNSIADFLNKVIRESEKENPFIIPIYGSANMAGDNAVFSIPVTSIAVVESSKIVKVKKEDIDQHHKVIVTMKNSEYTVTGNLTKHERYPSRQLNSAPPFVKITILAKTDDRKTVIVRKSAIDYMQDYTNY